MTLLEEVCQACSTTTDGRVVLVNENVYCKAIWVDYGNRREGVKRKCFIKEELNTFIFLSENPTG